MAERCRAGARGLRLFRLRQAQGSLRKKAAHVERVNYIARSEGRMAVTGAPEGYDAWLAVEAARSRGGLVVFVVSDDARASCAVEAMRFFAPEIEVLEFPAWDCLPYD